MVVVNRNALLIGLFAGVTAWVVSWLLTSVSSPFHEYFLFNVWLVNKWWLALNVLVLLVSIALDLPEGFEYLLIFLQWFLIPLAGFVVVRAVRKVASD